MAVDIDGDDRGIFDAGNAVEQGLNDLAQPDDLSINPPSADDAAVSDAIRSLSRGQPAPAPSFEPAKAPPQPGDGLDPNDDRSPGGLLRALLDERDKRQDISRQLERYQRQENDRKAQEEANQRPLSMRLFETPEEALTELREQITKPLAAQMSQMQLRYDFKLAALQHPKEFGDAWQAWYGKVGNGQDPKTYFAVMDNPSPGEALVQWYKDTQFRDRIGDDPDAYDRGVIERYLASQAGGQPQSVVDARPRTAPSRDRDDSGRFVASQETSKPQAPQRLPTATSRLGPSGMGHSDRDEDGSDDAIFASGRPSRRGDR